MDLQGKDSSDAKVCQRTVDIYHCSLALVYPNVSQHPGETGVKPPRDKTTTRHTAERSLISAVTFALVVLATHFIAGEEENFPDDEDLTEGAKETLKLIRQANPGIKMKVVPPHLVFNHDDSGQFLMRNKNDASHGKKQELLLTHTASLKGKGTMMSFIATQPLHRNGYNAPRFRTCSFMGT